MPTREEKLKTIRLANAMVREMTAELLDDATAAAVQRHAAIIDFYTGNVDWSQAPPEIREKFNRKPATATDAEFQAVLNEARQKRDGR